MNAPEHLPLPDTQSLPDTRELPIERVGVKGLRYPVALRTATGDVQNTIAEFAMYVGLAHDVKGTHMSRFVEILEEQRAPLDLDRIARDASAHAATVSGQSRAASRLRFPYFIRKAAPVSGVESLLDYDATVSRPRRAATDSHASLRADGAGHQPVPLFEEDLRLRRAQPALAHHACGSRCTVGELALEELARIAEEEHRASSSACSSAPTKSS